MINVLIAPQASLPSINVRFDESASADELRGAWQNVSSGTLQRHMRDAIWFECVRRGIDPHEVIPDTPSSN
jgi:hypothetical protein